ncbi:MAG: RagB/SusD family nutrient uptake outer membrane protein [Muribaculaceae bacterium]|nr:RagB/SusD family nutrient uptake outer membrane protein [Muribaculaceae bacterium]
MKKIYNIIAAGALLCGMTACEDWLDMPSESKADSESVFKTISRADMTVAGAYAQLHSQELGYQLLEGTDECASKESNSKYDVSNYNYTNLTGMLSKTYTQMYAAIEYANVCIKNLGSVPASSDADKKHLDGLMGEALAIRAYAYWNLLRFYGDVPYSNVPTSELTTFESSRTDRDYIYDRCVEDLQNAIELLPWLSESYLTTPERFSKNAAYGILARVALYAAGHSLRWDLSTVPYNNSTVRIAQRDDQARIRELYQIAADACAAVINHGENKLVDTYDQLFRDLACKRFNKESMFEYGWYGVKSVDVRTGYTNGIPGTGKGNPLFLQTGSQMITIPTLYFEFDEGDSRRDVSVCNYSLVLDSKSQAYRMNTYAGMGVGKYRINWKSGPGSNASHGDINWPMLRYADVLLMYAEALNELNNGATTEAVNAVKEVRIRAFGNEAKIGTIPTAYKDFRDYIIQERKLELNNEGLRRTDLTRWGIQYEYLMAEKAKLIQLAKHEGKYADAAPYWAFKIDVEPKLEDPTIALPHIDIKESDLALLELDDTKKDKLHIINVDMKSNKVEGSGQVFCNLYEADGNVYLNQSMVPAGVTAKPVQYVLINMWSINSCSQKGNLSVEEVKGYADKNPWLTSANGIFYGLTKNKTELMPFNTTSIIDVNPGLEGQQHPGYN